MTRLDPDPTGDNHRLLQELLALGDELRQAAVALEKPLQAVHPHRRAGARNLVHYLALRSRDRRPLQRRLAALGLSSLGRAEPHVLATVEAVISALGRLVQGPGLPPVSGQSEGAFDIERRQLAQHAEALFGPAHPGRDPRIMVTMPREAADDAKLVEALLRSGMNCMRINCAHDDSAAWGRMIAHLRRAEAIVGRPCRVMMDLAGPKLRTGPLAPGPRVLRLQPRRDAYGRVIAKARVRLVAQAPPGERVSGAGPHLPLPAPWLARRRCGEALRFTDARGARRTLILRDWEDDGIWGELAKTAYVVPGTRLRADDDEAPVGPLPPREGTLLLRPGDRLLVARDGRMGHSSPSGPAVIGCTLPEALAAAAVDQTIWFDDGKIGGIIEAVGAEGVTVHITHAPTDGSRLRADKGINLPDTPVELGALTAKDRGDLDFVARHADAVALSFVNTAADVANLRQELARRGSPSLAIVLKIETRRGFEHLPALLLTAMGAPCCGVMIARGDLAVECGFERLAEVQEEILWLCEAAHVPTIWATQVLENLAKEGLPSRAEITDAAMGHRAECVMLNKGPHVLRAVQVLDDILQRMQAHQTKKVAMLRALGVAQALGESAIPQDPVS